MAKSFTERERDVVRRSLLAACKECWSRYGYHKTGIREIAELAGVSTGAFYQFFVSKELLFVEAVREYERDMERLFAENMGRSPDKRGVAAALKAVAAYIDASPWIGQLRDDWAIISRKLPEDFLEQDFLHDKLRVEELTRRYGLKMTKSTEFVTTVIDAIFISAAERFLPKDGGAAINFIIDSVVENLFE